MSDPTPQTCQQCFQAKARRYEQYAFSVVGEAAQRAEFWLCAKCARQRRRSLPQALSPAPNQMSRAELIAELDRFWSASGAGEICRRCHEQGTGCCPPMCRHLSAQGCGQKNVFCTGFVCSALLNGIAECDGETGRVLKWAKRNVATTEFRVYEMVTRVAAIDREPMRPLTVPDSYPGPLKLEGQPIKAALLQLADEILEIRRRWHGEELQQVQDIKPS